MKNRGHCMVYLLLKTRMEKLLNLVFAPMYIRNQKEKKVYIDASALLVPQAHFVQCERRVEQVNKSCFSSQVVKRSAAEFNCLTVRQRTRARHATSDF